MLNFITIKIRYNKEMIDIGVATKLDMLNDQLEELKKLIKHLTENKFMIFVPLKNKDQEHCVRIKGVAEDIWVKMPPEPKIDSLPNGEHLLEDAVEMACRKNNVAIPEFMMHHLSNVKPRTDAWLPQLSNYKTTALAFSIAAMLVATKVMSNNCDKLPEAIKNRFGIYC